MAKGVVVMRYTAILTSGPKNVILEFEEQSDMVSDLLCSAISSATEDDMSLFTGEEAVWVREIREVVSSRLVYLQDATHLPDALQVHLAFDPNPFEA